MPVVATNKHAGGFLADSPAERGLETTVSLVNARRFADQTEVDGFVSARNGPANVWFAMTLPA